MPLSAFAISDIFARAVRSMESHTGDLRPWQLAARISQVMGLQPSMYGYGTDQGLHNAVWSVVRQAAAAVQFGSSIQPQSHLTPNPPRVPGIGPAAPDYEYRVVVRVRDPTGRETRTAVTIRTDAPVDYDTLRRLAGEVVANMKPHEGDTPGRRRISEMTDYTVAGIVVVYAGRR